MSGKSIIYTYIYNSPLVLDIDSFYVGILVFGGFGIDYYAFFLRVY